MIPPGPLPVIDVVPVLRAVCSWCGKTTREGSEPVTHSICPPCADDVRATIRARVQVAANVAAVAPRVLRWRDGLPPDPSIQAPRFVEERRSFEGPAAPDAVMDPGRRESSPGRLRSFVRDNWATLILVALLLAHSAWHTWGVR